MQKSVETKQNQQCCSVGFDVSRLFPSRNGLETSVMAHLNSNGRWPPRPPVSCPALKPARRVSRSALWWMPSQSWSDHPARTASADLARPATCPSPPSRFCRSWL